MEIWKDIKGYEGLYQASNLGNIRSLRFINGTTNRERIKVLKPQIRNNYYIVNLVNNGIRKTHSVHRLVAQTFLNKPEDKEVVNHKDYNTFNNKVDNLEWCTQKQNINHSLCHMRGIVHHIKPKELYGITFRNRGKKYELTIKQKYYGRFKTLKEAKQRRKEILDELKIAI